MQIHIETAPGSMATDGALDWQTDFRKIYDTFQPKILRYLTHLVGEPEAEDLAQEVFVKVSQALSRFRQESHLSTWIYRIATNAAIDRRRSRAFQETIRQQSSSEVMAEEMTDPVEGQLIRKEMNACIRGFVENLPTNFRSVVVLSELEELSNEAIAEVLGISLATVKIRLHRARTLLRKEFATRCDFYRDEGNVLLCDPKITGVSFRN
jgi:RNA polymerase sigma-70 factor (ECF subfamily)